MNSDRSKVSGSFLTFFFWVGVVGGVMFVNTSNAPGWVLAVHIWLYILAGLVFGAVFPWIGLACGRAKWLFTSDPLWIAEKTQEREIQVKAAEYVLLGCGKRAAIRKAIEDLRRQFDEVESSCRSI